MAMTRPAGTEPLPVSLSNPRADRVREVRALAGRSARERAGLFLVEGPSGVRAAVDHALPRVRNLYVSESALRRAPWLGDVSLAVGRHLHLGTDEVLDAMSPDCQGVLAVVESWSVGLDALPDSPALVAVLAHVRDPGNAGTAIRSAAAAGASAVVFAGECVERTNPKVVRATAGSLFTVPVVEDVTLADAVANLRDRGLRILATNAAGTVTLGGEGADSAALAAPTAWIFGNEAWGLSAEDVALADATVKIPLFGDVESLNLAASVAVCLYASAMALPRDQGAREA